MREYKKSIDYYLDKRNKPKIATGSVPFAVNGTKLYPLYIRVIAFRKVTRFQSKFYLYCTGNSQQFVDNFISEQMFEDYIIGKRNGSLKRLTSKEVLNLERLIGLIREEDRDRLTFSRFSEIYERALTDVSKVFFKNYFLEAIRKELDVAFRKESARNHEFELDYSSLYEVIKVSPDYNAIMGIMETLLSLMDGKKYPLMFNHLTEAIKNINGEKILLNSYLKGRNIKLIEWQDGHSEDFKKSMETQFAITLSKSVENVVANELKKIKTKMVKRLSAISH